MSDKFRPIRTTQIRCTKCGNVAMMQVDEKACNTVMVNFVQKIRESERAKLNERLALLEKVAEAAIKVVGSWQEGDADFKRLQQALAALGEATREAERK